MKKMATLAVTLTAAALLVACHPESGPAGTVTDRDKRHLTVQKPYNGEEVRFRVSKATARSCPEGSSYPECAGGDSFVRQTKPAPKPDKPTPKPAPKPAPRAKTGKR